MDEDLLLDGIWTFRIVSLFWISYGSRIVKAFRILMEKMMVTNCWILCIFWIIIVFGM